MGLTLQEYREKITGKRYTLVGFANQVGTYGQVIQTVAIYHPDADPNSLYVIGMDLFNKCFEKWKAENEQANKPDRANTRSFDKFDRQFKNGEPKPFLFK